MKSCLQMDPEKRPSVSQMLESPLFKDYSESLDTMPSFKKIKVKTDSSEINAKDYSSKQLQVYLHKLA